MTAELGTTNVLLGVIAAVSLLEALAVIGLIAGAYSIYRRAREAVDGIEQRQIAPAAARVNEILDDVRSVTSTVKKQGAAIETAIDWVVNRLMRGRRVS